MVFLASTLQTSMYERSLVPEKGTRYVINAIEKHQ